MLQPIVSRAPSAQHRAHRVFQNLRPGDMEVEKTGRVLWKTWRARALQIRNTDKDKGAEHDATQNTLMHHFAMESEADVLNLLTLPGEPLHGTRKFTYRRIPRLANTINQQSHDNEDNFMCLPTRVYYPVCTDMIVGHELLQPGLEAFAEFDCETFPPHTFSPDTRRTESQLTARRLCRRPKLQPCQGSATMSTVGASSAVGIPTLCGKLSGSWDSYAVTPEEFTSRPVFSPRSSHGLAAFTVIAARAYPFFEEKRNIQVTGVRQNSWWWMSVAISIYTRKTGATCLVFRGGPPTSPQHPEFEPLQYLVRVKDGSLPSIIPDPVDHTRRFAQFNVRKGQLLRYSAYTQPDWLEEMPQVTSRSGEHDR
ncbi:uncharacterized protein MYCFIDRAFT_180253 [Pseudocercospora fijiensis CIRAD86]|uniref:Uncharacterized protein n=1 Tax=Pseudocercospora fijiensis (strain CIRAD86) TaxID=383855 RepID=M3AIT7_PSEFD|nr:uncharacterized protein MYCFIDRAFT_180253 [Pseudocercospora fijiensis CIRAD86]EME77108.1 hypothetical protein MYCFIDRAFT_180253 [Pseudocercospora fijiensis CIRAD86]